MTSAQTFGQGVGDVRRFLYRWIVNSIALIIVGLIFKERVYLADPGAALVAALVLGIVNAALRPLLLILTLPINILTLGLFTLVINGLMLWLVSSLVSGFNIRGGFWSTVLVGLVLSLVSGLIGGLLGD